MYEVLPRAPAITPTNARSGPSVAFAPDLELLGARLDFTNLSLGFWVVEFSWVSPMGTTADLEARLEVKGAFGARTTEVPLGSGFYPPRRWSSGEVVTDRYLDMAPAGHQPFGVNLL